MAKGNTETLIYICPFAQFGNAGTQSGAELLGDGIREMLADNEQERRPHRARAYQPHVRIEELDLATPEDVRQWRDRAGKEIKKVMAKDEFFIWIGGNHLSVLPVYEELAHHDGSLVVQFDAHLDVYHFDDTVKELSHGNFVRQLPAHRPAIINLGHRDQSLKPETIAKHFKAAHSAEALATDSAAMEVDVRRQVQSAERVVIDTDWDVLDPAYFPAVVDALPFGIAPSMLLSMLKWVWGPNVAGVCLSEFDSGRDDRDRSLQLALWLIEQILLWRYED